MPKAISDFFKTDLRAKLNNVQWSWGATNEQFVFLRAWDQDWDRPGKRILILGNDWGTKSLGHPERVDHIRQIQAGKPAYLVILQGVRNEDSGNMQITDYLDDVFAVSHVAADPDGRTFAYFAPNGRTKPYTLYSKA